MITRLGNYIAEALVTSNVIPEEDIDLYGYGFFLMLSSALYFAIAAILGAALGILWQSILFYLLFSLLREYAGGVHANTEQGCMLSTTSAFVLSIIAIRKLSGAGQSIFTLICLLAACTVLFFLSPMDTPQRRLSVDDRNRYRKISKCLATGNALLGIVSAVAGWRILYPMTLATTLSSILLLYIVKSMIMHVRMPADNHQ